VQLRIKNQSSEVIRDQIRESRALCETFKVQLVINDYWQLALEENCDFVHLGQEDLTEADLGALQRAGVRLGISTNSEEELERALVGQPAYVALGPIYPTKLKAMRWAPQGLDRIAQWKAKIGDIPLVAIGGLTPERAEAVLRAGADCAAVVTDILLHE